MGQRRPLFKSGDPAWRPPLRAMERFPVLRRDRSCGAPETATGRPSIVRGPARRPMQEGSGPAAPIGGLGGRKADRVRGAGNRPAEREPPDGEQGRPDQAE